MSFVTGEVSPKLDARPDLAKISNAARTVRNMIVHPYGRVERRAGTRFIAHARAQQPDGTPSGSGSGEIVWSNLAINGTVFDMAFQSDGSLIIVGEFTSVGGETHERIARISHDGTVDSSFTASLTQSGMWVSPLGAQAVAVQGDDKIVVGGRFNAANGTTRYALARFNSDGTLDSSFDVGLPDTASMCPFGIVVDSTGRIVAAGAFAGETVQGVTIGFAMRFASDGTIDAGFTEATDRIANGEVRRILLVSGDRIYLLGLMGSLADGGNLRCLSLLDADGTVAWSIIDTDWTRLRDGVVLDDDTLVCAGWFDEIGGEPRSAAAVVDVNGNITSIAPVMSSIVWSVGVDESGRYYFGGGETQLGTPSPSSYLRRTEASGADDPSFDVIIDGDVHIIRERGGILYIGGDFNTVNGETRGGIARLTTSGALS